MYKDEPYGLYKYGYIEDLEKITAKDLYNHYLELLKSSEIDIYFSGNLKEDMIVERYSHLFSEIERNYIDERDEKNFLINDVLDSKLNEINESQNVTQGKLVLGFKLKRGNIKQDFYKMTVYSAILGGTASSKLFNNVREKKSLAYTISSQYIKHKGALFVAAGIELDKYDVAKESILKEINDMKIGEITDEELHDAKVNLITRFKSFNDSQAALIGWAVGQEILDGDMDLDVVIKRIEAITKEDVVEVANRLEQSITYYLKS
jgi:predicted Zn-dependent peptidase